MPTIINEPYSKGNVFGRLGHGLGQGLAEQLPKGIERGALSQGLKSLGQKDLTGKNRLEILGEIQGIPGITPQLADQALSQIRAQNYFNRGGGGAGGEQKVLSPAVGVGATNTVAPNAVPVTQGKETIPSKELQKNGLASVKQIGSYKANQLKPINTDQTLSLAKDIYDSGAANTPEEAHALAKEQLETNRKAQIESNSILRDDVSKRMALDLQGHGLGDYKDVAGEIQNQLLDQAEYMVNELGMTPAQASQKVSDIIKEFGKSTSRLEEFGSLSDIDKLTTSSKKKEALVKAQGKDFEKYGFGEQFADLVSGVLGITPLQTANLLTPLKNQKIKDVIDSTKSRGRGKIDRKDMDTLIKSIEPGDNLFSIEYLMREGRIDQDEFVERLSELDSKDEVALTEKQRRQLQKPINGSILGDLLFKIF